MAASSRHVVYAVDIFDGFKHRGEWYERQLVELAGNDESLFENFRKHTLQGPWAGNIVVTVTADLNLKWLGGAIGFLHLDHEHTAYAVMSSLQHWRGWMLADAVVGIHDYFSLGDPDVRRGADAVGMQVIGQAESLAICKYPEVG